MENLPFFRPWKLFPCGKTMTFGLQRTRRRKRRKINTNEKWWKIKMNISSHGKSMASVFQRRIITNEKLPRNNRKLTFFPILKTFSSRKINFWPSKNEKKEKKLLKRMKNCLKNDGKSRRILPFLPVENRGGFCLSKKNHHEWKIERRNNGKFTGIDVTFFPILKTFSWRKENRRLLAFGKKGRKRRRKRRRAAPYPASGAKRVRGWFCCGGVEGRWRGCGRGYRNVALQLGLVRVSRLADSWLLLFRFRRHLFAFAYFRSSRFSHVSPLLAHLPSRRRVWHRFATVLVFTLFTGSFHGI